MIREWAPIIAAVAFLFGIAWCADQIEGLVRDRDSLRRDLDQVCQFDWRHLGACSRSAQAKPTADNPTVGVSGIATTAQPSRQPSPSANPSTVMTTSASGFMLAGGVGPDGKTHRLRVDALGRVECVP